MDLEIFQDRHGNVEVVCAEQQSQVRVPSHGLTEEEYLVRVIVELRHRDGDRGHRMAAESRGESASTDPAESTLQLQYGEICKSHEAISQFRAKLLALLPIASGAGALVLLGPLSDAKNLRFFLPLGLYGFVVTLGLFMYECRGMQVCHMLQDRAKGLEAALGLRSDQGQFRNRSTANLAGIVGAEGAAWIIYPAILAGWLYITGMDPRLGWWHRNRGWVLSVLFAVVVGWTWRRLHENLTAARRAGESTDTPRPG